MRTLKSIFAALFIVSFMSFTFANDNNTSISTESAMFVEARSNAKNSVDLRLANVPSQKITIRLKDETGSVLYFEKLKQQTAYFKHFVLSELPDGNYCFAISQANTKDIIKKFSIENGTVQVDYFKTIFSNKAAATCALKVISVSKDAANLHLTNNTFKKVTIRLKDQNGKVWYFDKIAAQDTYQKRFVLSHLPDGKYSFSVEADKETFKQTLQIKDGVAQIKQDIPRA